MSYNLRSQLIASETRSGLAELVNGQLRACTLDERPQLIDAANTINKTLKGVADDVVVDLQCYGSNTPGTGDKTFFISITARPVRSATKQADVPVWTPEETGTTETAVPGSTSTPAATTATTTQPAATALPPAPAATTTTQPAATTTATRGPAAAG